MDSVPSVWLPDSLLLWGVLKGVSRVEDRQIIGVLHITLLEAKRDSMLLRKEMQSVKSFCLGFSNSRNIRRPGQAPVAGKGPPRILNDQSLRGRFGAGLIVKQRLQRVLLASSTETVTSVREGLFAE